MKFSLIVAFFVDGCVIGAKLTTCASSCWLMQFKVGVGSPTRFSACFFACLKLPCTVVRVMMIAEPPAGIVGL